MPVILYAVILFLLTVAKVMNEEQRINVCKTGLNQIYEMLRTGPHNYRSYLTLARSVITHLDSTTFMQQSTRTAEQAWMIAGLQRLAALDNGNGATADITTWCARQWNVVYQRDPQNVAALRGIGQAWLARAQPVLTRIHRVDGSSSSSNESSQRSYRSISASEEERQSAAATREAERRAGTQDYVEARGYLQPATEYLDRAMTAASEQEILSGDLLATVRNTVLQLNMRLLTQECRLRRHTCHLGTLAVLATTNSYSGGPFGCCALRRTSRDIH